MKATLIPEFRHRFQKEPDHVFFCPGRVNLIGEHIDYNGGIVMPCALSLGTWLAVAKNTDKTLRFHSLNFSETVALHLQDTYSKAGNQWFNYPLGIINELVQMKCPVSGLDMLFSGNLPVGAGLSSSASIEILTAYALNELFALGISLHDLVRIAQKSENEFIGVACGIMDQFAVAFGKKNHALLLHCDSLEYQYLPLELGDFVLAILNTNKPRTLVESKYNERFTECGRALKALKKELSVNQLCDVNLHQFTAHRHLIQNPVLEKRVLHVISEQFRVKEAADALKSGDLYTFGKLMFASHLSLRNFYEVTGKELDTLVNFCKNYPDCIGARMTGAGFGGCAIALVKKEILPRFEEELSLYYEKIIGYKPTIFSSVIGDGVRRIA